MGTRGFLEEKAERCQSLRATPTPPEAASSPHTQGCPAPRPARPRQGILGSTRVGGVKERQGVQLLRREGRGPQAWTGHHSTALAPPASNALLLFPPAVTKLRDLAQGWQCPGQHAPNGPPHPPTQGQYGTRERHAMEPGEPECPWSPAPPGLARPTLETGRLSQQWAWAALGRWPSLRGPGNASLPHCMGGKGGGHLGTQALTQSSPAGAAGPRHQPGAGRAARPSSLEPPPCSQSRRSGTAEGCRAHG